MSRIDLLLSKKCTKSAATSLMIRAERRRYARGLEKEKLEGKKKKLSVEDDDEKRKKKEKNIK